MLIGFSKYVWLYQEKVLTVEYTHGRVHLDNHRSVQARESLHDNLGFGHAQAQVVLEEADAAPGEEHDVAVRLQALAGGAVPCVRVLQAEYARVHVPRDPEAGVVQALEERVHAARGVEEVVKGDEAVLAVLLDDAAHVLREVLLGAQLGLLDGLLANVDAVVVLAPTRLLERRERCQSPPRGSAR